MMIDYKLLYKKTREILDSCDLNYIDEKASMAELSLGSQQMVEIASILAKDAKVVILDEPTSALTEVEVKRLNSLIEDMKSRGITIIYISHKLGEILYLADTITVLKDGKHVITMPNSSEVTKETLVRHMVGRDVAYDYKVGSNAIGEVLIKVQDLSSGKMVQDVSFEVRRGEILGIAGLEGSGRTELLETLFGWRHKTAGKIYVNGKEVANRTPEEAKKNKFAYITKERKLLGLFLELDITNNTSAASTELYKKWRLVDYQAMAENAKKYVTLMNTKVTSVAQKVMNLSGGNQQKVLLSMWLSADPDILMIDEPTRGIDIGAKSEIHMLLRDIVSRGKAVIMVSSEMPEIMASCDKTIVMCEGRITGILSNQELSEEKMMQLASKA
jgi:ABC-type sugar transport system ATPase subunit